MEIKKEYNLEQIIDDLQVGINASNNGSTNKVKINVMLAVEIVEVLKEINSREQKRLHDCFDRARNKPETKQNDDLKDKEKPVRRCYGNYNSDDLDCVLCSDGGNCEQDTKARRKKKENA